MGSLLRGAGGAIALGLLSGVSCATAPAAGGGAARSSLADFTLPDTAGRELRLSDLVGKQLVYLDFWATWCGPCAAEMPHLERMYEAYKDRGLTIVGVSMDDPSTQGSVASYVHRTGLTFPVVIDTESKATALYNSTRSAPYGVLIDRSGHIVEEKAGYTPGDEVLLEARIKDNL